LLTGKCVFEDEDISELHKKQLAAAPRATVGAPKIKSASHSNQAILRCLERRPERRPQSALSCAIFCSPTRTRRTTRRQPAPPGGPNFTGKNNLP